MAQSHAMNALFSSVHASACAVTTCAIWTGRKTGTGDYDVDGVTTPPNPLEIQ